MKKRLLLFILIGTLCFSGCKQEEVTEKPVNFDDVVTLPQLKAYEPYVFPDREKFELFDSLVTTHMNEQQGNISLGLIDLDKESEYFDELNNSIELNLVTNKTDSSYTAVLYNDGGVSATYYIVKNYTDPDDIYISYCLQSKTMTVTRDSYSAPNADIEYYDKIKVRNTEYTGTDLEAYDGDIKLWGNYVQMVINSLSE